jgi:hypothetical protein
MRTIPAEWVAARNVRFIGRTGRTGVARPLMLINITRRLFDRGTLCPDLPRSHYLTFSAIRKRGTGGAANTSAPGSACREFLASARGDSLPAFPPWCHKFVGGVFFVAVQLHGRIVKHGLVAFISPAALPPTWSAGTSWRGCQPRIVTLTCIRKLVSFVHCELN